MKINIIVAASNNNAIGKNNELLWHLPNDMKFFKNTTWSMPVIMGRKTYEALGKPLAGRTNIVITRKQNWQPENVVVVNSLDQAIKAAADTDAKEAFVIGGGEIYKQALPITETVYLTRVNAVLEGDTYFEILDMQQWQLFAHLDFKADEKHAYDYSFETWKRKVA
jgi:dihydrofolate reductase